MTTAVTTETTEAIDAAGDIIRRTNTEEPDESDVAELRRILAEDHLAACLFRCSSGCLASDLVGQKMGMN